MQDLMNEIEKLVDAETKIDLLDGKYNSPEEAYGKLDIAIKEVERDLNELKIGMNMMERKILLDDDSDVAMRYLCVHAKLIVASAIRVAGLTGVPIRSENLDVFCDKICTDVCKHESNEHCEGCVINEL